MSPDHNHEQNHELNPEKKMELFFTREDNAFIRSKPKYWLHILLFVTTFFSLMFAGTAWANVSPYELSNLSKGLLYAVLIMSIITAHEFGHYIAARIHKIDVTLPFYIPFPFIEFNPFGTMGAVIRIKSMIRSRKALFDMAVAGPIAGFVVTIIVLIIGFTTLPGIEYIYQIHPEYRTTGIPTSGNFSFGYNILFWSFEKIFTSSPTVFMPPMNEVYHYPFLCAGWFGLLITALNMLPVGQLDGGHISYAMFGSKSKFVAYITFGLLVFFGLLGLPDLLQALGVLPPLGFDISIGSVGWLIWALLIYFVIKIIHPPIVQDFNAPLGTTRVLLGWFSYFIFIVSFCPVPLT
ncbi:MAG TPA: site-2 protease family protein [Ignavibacteria bacterium]|nr:site-2 protease family protein [Ignavibacteria bacterium]